MIAWSWECAVSPPVGARPCKSLLMAAPPATAFAGRRPLSDAAEAGLYRLSFIAPAGAVHGSDEFFMQLPE